MRHQKTVITPITLNNVRYEIEATPQNVKVTRVGRAGSEQWLAWDVLHQAARQKDPELSDVYSKILRVAQAQLGGPSVMAATRDLAHALEDRSILPERFQEYAYTEEQRKKIRAQIHARVNDAWNRGGRDRYYAAAGTPAYPTYAEVTQAEMAADYLRRSEV